MEQKILTEEQQRVIFAVGREQQLFNFYYLSGGTALAAYYFHHRISDDLDFFTFEETDKIFLHAFAGKLKNVTGAKSVRFARLYDRNQFFFSLGKRELKVEFTKYPFPQLADKILKDGVHIDSLRDLAANKLMAILDRFDPKDFVDFFFLLRDFKLDDIRLDVEKKFGVSVDNIFLGGELAKVRRVEFLPKMIKRLAVAELKSFFEEQAKSLASKTLE